VVWPFSPAPVSGPQVVGWGSHVWNPKRLPRKTTVGARSSASTSAMEESHQLPLAHPQTPTPPHPHIHKHEQTTP